MRPIWCALSGLDVTLQDRAPKYIGPAIKRAHELFARRVRDKYQRLAAHDRLMPDVAGDGVRRADVIIEAIVEDVAAKRALFQELEAKGRPQALLATNTSSIPEIVGDAGLLVSPNDAGHFAAAMRRVLENPELRLGLGEAAARQAGRFSWHDAARRTLEVYATVGVSGAVSPTPDP